MEGIFFLLSVIGVGVIMWWVFQNDKAGPTEPTRGLFAMPGTREENQSAGVAAAKPQPNGVPPPAVAGRQSPGRAV